jgi:hypothetical protein
MIMITNAKQILKKKATRKYLEKVRHSLFGK